MTQFKYLYVILASILLLGSCKDDEPSVIKDPLVVSFKEKSINFNNVTDKHNILFSFSEKPENNGSILVKINEENMTYGVDYKTIPEATNGIVEIPFSGENYQNTKLSYVTLIPPTSNKRKLSFQITKINYDNSIIQGYTDFEFSYENSKGGVVLPNVGGPNEPNQVFIDLSSNTQKTVKRDSWSLGFHTGQEFGVIINHSTYAMAGAIESTDIDSVKKEDFEEVLKRMNSESPGDFVDNGKGDFSDNAIAEISTNNQENKVYLLNLGFKISTKTPKTGSVSINGDPLGLKKVRILRKNNGYLLQYANLNETTHKEVLITKDENQYAFTYFDIITEKKVKIAPRKTDWDLSFTPFTVRYKYSGSVIAYQFSDYILSNKIGGVKIYSIIKTEKDLTESKYQAYIDAGLMEKNNTLTYEQFNKNNLTEYISKLKSSRPLPGSVWRNIFSKSTNPIYFIIQDTDGNVYKMKLSELINDKNERGYPEFEYELIE